MTIYIITEKQNSNSTRAGEKYDAKSLSQAKRYASHSQLFEGTVMTIRYENGKLVSEKINGRWVDNYI